MLSVRSSIFNGSLPFQLCHFVDLQLLDLSSNDLSRKISKCLGNITTMKKIGSENVAIDDPYISHHDGGEGVLFDFYNDKLALVWKGVISEFKKSRTSKEH